MCNVYLRMARKKKKKNRTILLNTSVKIYNRFIACSFDEEHMAQPFKKKTWTHYVSKLQEDQLLGKTINTKGQ